jgi:glucose/arabinose dehydrogenase
LSTNGRLAVLARAAGRLAVLARAGRADGRPAALAPALLCTALACVALAGCGAGTSEHARTSAPAATSARAATSGLVAIGAGLRGPAGLKATVYARGPATAAAFTFDPQGRLWLTAAGLETHTQDGVYMIPRPGARAQKIVAGLDDPLGLEWYRDRLYVASVGRVDAYGGFDGRRFTEHTRILDGPVSRGENNLLLMDGEGRFVMGITATCDHCAPASKFAGSIVTFAPDGGDLRLYARRIRAPFGLAYFPGTSDLFVTMNQQDNLGARTPGDWLAVVREGEDWRFPYCHGQAGAACAGVPAPTAVLDKHAAVGGVAIVTGQLGASVGTAAIVPEWNVAKVQRVALTRTASGYRGSVTPLLTGIRNPLAIALAPGGRSLLVGDWATGTIYRVERAAR